MKMTAGYSLLFKLLLGVMLYMLEAAPTGYLADWAQQNPALPDQCLLYEQRYDVPRIGKLLAEGPKGDSQHVVIMKLHTIKTGLKQDQALAFKALAAEVLHVGYDFHILYDQGKQPGMTPWQTLNLLPAELQRFVLFHNFAEAQEAYPVLKSTISRGNGRTGPGPPFAYLPTLNFMIQHAQYQWLWEVEYDVRLIGAPQCYMLQADQKGASQALTMGLAAGHWGRFLNSVLHLAHAAEANKAWDKKEGLHKGLDTMSQADTLPVLSSSAATPDLVFFGVASFGRKWQGTQVGMNASAVWHAVIMVWGGSRKLFNAMHLMSEKGQGSYVESFLTHVAHDHDLKVVPVALPRQAGTYNCCSKVGTLIYERFKNSTSICTHSALLHPVKASDDHGWTLA